MSRQSDDDRALERLLRTSLSEPPGPVTPTCVDPERLAAWSDGALSPAERASVEAHVSACARCLAMLQVFANAHDAPAPHGRPVPLDDRGQANRGAWRWPMRWVVPIATAAAAVLIWAVLPTRPTEQAFAPSTQIARDEAAPVETVPQRFDDLREERARESNARSTPPPAAAPPAATSKAAEPGAEAEVRQQQTLDSVQERPAQEPASRPVAGAQAERAANEALSDRAAATAPQAARPEAPAPPAALMRAESASIEIHSPDPAYRWRVRGSIVERSTTGGASWQTTVVPAGVVLTAGASSSPTVCWLVGPRGTVLRTTDGSRFESANIPGAEAIVSIEATDANQARVTTAGGQVYTTRDGGKSWTR